MTIDKRAIWSVTLWVSVAVFVGFVLSSVAPRFFPIFHPRAYLTAILMAVTIITFFGFLRAGTGPNGTLDETVMRTSITVTILTVYLILMSIVAFWTRPSTPTAPPTGQPTEQTATQAGGEELPLLTQTMLTNFTTLVGVVIAFYFTSAAYVEGKKEETKQAEAKSTTHQPLQG